MTEPSPDRGALSQAMTALDLRATNIDEFIDATKANPDPVARMST